VGRRRGWKISFGTGRNDEAEAQAGQPCARGIRCEERDYQGSPKYGPRTFCETDSRNIRRDILDLPQHYAALRGLLAYAQAAGERVSGSKEPLIPLATDVEEFMREVVHIACSWEDAVRARASLADLPDGKRRDGVMLAGACRTLAGEYRGHEITGGHFEALLNLGPQEMVRPAAADRVDEIIAARGDELDDGVIRYDTSGDAWENVTMDGTAAALEFLGLNGRARGMLGLSRQRRRVTEVRCDDCKSRTLVQYEARDGGWDPVVKCTNCPNTYTGQRFEFLMGRVYEAQAAALDGHQQAS
jgi:hypothetical protein